MFLLCINEETVMRLKNPMPTKKVAVPKVEVIPEIKPVVIAIPKVQEVKKSKRRRK